MIQLVFGMACIIIALSLAHLLLALLVDFNVTCLREVEENVSQLLSSVDDHAEKTLHLSVQQYVPQHTCQLVNIM